MREHLDKHLSKNEKMLARFDHAIMLVAGVFIVSTVRVLMEYLQDPYTYAMQTRPRPWYGSILVYGIVTAVIVATCLIGKAIIRRKIPKDWC